VDTYSRNFKNDPTYVNFGDNGEDNGQAYIVNGNASVVYNFVDYEEGIYVGYRYFETRGAGDAAWYGQNVVFPFGYGLSYTTFAQTIVNKAALDGSVLTAKGKLSVQVKVDNTGDRAGKDVVQVYVSAPYAPGGIEKAGVVLAGFAKTPLINAGASATVTVEIDPYLFASYDYADKNGNGFKGYELDAGTYAVTIRGNAHETIDGFNCAVGGAGIRYEKDPITNVSVVNRYDDAAAQLGSELSRNAWAATWPEKRADRTLDAATKAALDDRATNNPIQVSAALYPEVGSGGGTKFRDVLDKPYDDPVWDDLLDVLSIAEMTALVTDGQFKTASVSSINAPATVNADGPFGFVNFLGDPSVYGCAYYASEVVLASTWNIELAEELGNAVGDEALVGNEKGDRLPYTGWYAPGVNIHRSPFGGRSGEYFSEDSLLTGKMAAGEVRGAREKGVITFVKHFAVNEQETSRTGIATWLTEQALREIYLRPFEIAVKEGKTTAIMSSFNRIGTMWTGGDYRLLTEILRNEWGFQGMVVCDYNSNNAFMDPRQMIFAGGDLHLFAAQTKLFSPNKGSATDITVLREASKNILYTVANSNIRDYDIVGYRIPKWEVWLFVVDAVIVASLAGYGVYAFLRARKKDAAVTSPKSISD
jgi:beta-glucosidase